MYIHRAIEPSISNLSKTFPVLLVIGPRQVGKTTLLKHMAEDGRSYVTLDDPDARLLAKSDPALFLQQFPPPVLIDEIQYGPEILPYVKMYVDRTGRKGDFWLTGSQMFHTMRHISESLAGRVGIVTLLALSNSEINGFASRPFLPAAQGLAEREKETRRMLLPEIYQRIFRGGMPALYAESEENSPDLETFFRSYLNTYIQRDIRDLTQVADEMAFYRFMIALAARTAKPVIYEELAKEVGVSAPTIKSWLSVLVSSHIIALVQPYHNNVLKRMVKMPLLHFLDTGLCAYLLKWGSSQVLERSAMAGSFLETWVFSEIYKSWLNAGLEPPVYYYRDKDKREIDLLVFRDGVLYPLEIKKSASPGSEAIHHFNALKPLTAPERFGGLSELKVEIGTGAVICLSEKLFPIDRDNWYIPAWMI